MAARNSEVWRPFDSYPISSKSQKQRDELKHAIVSSALFGALVGAVVEVILQRFNQAAPNCFVLAGLTVTVFQFGEWTLFRFVVPEASRRQMVYAISRVQCACMLLFGVGWGVIIVCGELMIRIDRFVPLTYLAAFFLALAGIWVANLRAVMRTHSLIRRRVKTASEPDDDYFRATVRR